MVLSISNITRKTHKDSQGAHWGGRLSFECRSIILGFFENPDSDVKLFWQ